MPSPSNLHARILRVWSLLGQRIDRQREWRKEWGDGIEH